MYSYHILEVQTTVYGRTVLGVSRPDRESKRKLASCSGIASKKEGCSTSKLR